MSVKYEWDWEQIDGDGEILDHYHSDRIEPSPFDLDSANLVLVRDVGSISQGLEYREWAYVTVSWHLPQYFQDSSGNRGSKVPERFHKEIAKFREML